MEDLIFKNGIFMNAGTMGIGYLRPFTFVELDGEGAWRRAQKVIFTNGEVVRPFVTISLDLAGGLRVGGRLDIRKHAMT